MTDATPDSLPDLSDLQYDPQNFRDLAETELGEALWAFLKRPDNIIRMETATLLDRVAVEPLATGLVRRFGGEVQDDRTKQMIGHMARQLMEALNYELDRSGLRVTRPGLFASGSTYRQPGRGERPMNITREQREAWVKNTANSPFNVWLDKQVKRPDGTLDLEKLYAVARRYGVDKRYDRLNPGQQRMNIGVLLRTRVPKEDYAGT
ncbi:hypothetical protein [Azospirillum argentinense]|uniref:hypothetical protein n=1 Tax=Azospirillum argentinense TaxID=2970906 RepID=UPI0032DFE599